MKCTCPECDKRTNFDLAPQKTGGGSYVECPGCGHMWHAIRGSKRLYAVRDFVLEDVCVQSASDWEELLGVLKQCNLKYDPKRPPKIIPYTYKLAVVLLDFWYEDSEYTLSLSVWGQRCMKRLSDEAKWIELGKTIRVA